MSDGSDRGTFEREIVEAGGDARAARGCLYRYLVIARVPTRRVFDGRLDSACSSRSSGDVRVENARLRNRDAMHVDLGCDYAFYL